LNVENRPGRRVKNPLEGSTNEVELNKMMYLQTREVQSQGQRQHLDYPRPMVVGLDRFVSPDHVEGKIVDQ